MNGVNPWALGVFVFFFAATIVIGSSIQWIRKTLSRGKSAHSSEDWSLGGRQFGPWVTWFLVGGDFYTAYTVIAVPALVYAAGGYGFFALPYTIIVYPFIFLVMPRLWKIAQEGGYATAADIVRARFNSRALEIVVALTGLVAVMPYIALQLIGIRTVVQALGLPGDIPLVIAFLSLAAYTWLGGLHAPALTAFIKDIMIYIAVLVAVTVIPLHMGGYAALFTAADHSQPILKAGMGMPYATLALSSALAAFLYPHTLTGILAARSADTIRQNAVFLPIYTIVLGLIAMLGLMAHVAGVTTTNNSLVVPLLFQTIFPAWFSGFCFAAIAVGALVPAAVMAIGAANLVTHNLLPARHKSVRNSRLTAFAVKVGALLCVMFLNAQFAIDFQLLGGVIILQTFPALILGLMRIRFSAAAMLAGWVVGTVFGVGLCLMDSLKPIHFLYMGPFSGNVSTGLMSLVVNIVVVGLITLVKPAASADYAKPEDRPYAAGNRPTLH
ncbi:Na+/solute symporter [Acetobacter tropicalis NRIC 0312]|uniref:Sodium:solute symporter n=1 Tax=Acetobacter tropicalis TaxID=104102 RepID=A0A0C9LMM6_9PROT|nr:sodium:solute symporter family protein [Acetobacter tropicalis]KXV50437.1 sodium:solute symporter [Acetobacter tropicalis]KXV59277.1 sodium:solute symporter [Acetobacter tropicalis]OUI87267.1 sodium:solute symporter [Acetobacter tropicalis]GAL96255.1 sodium:solute symporter [Acetobacter tropicalis]GBR69299.1 Na+/solute symporter [Acetobacter tropicalis NRIC 0312]